MKNLKNKKCWAYYPFVKRVKCLRKKKKKDVWGKNNKSVANIFRQIASRVWLMNVCKYVKWWKHCFCLEGIRIRNWTFSSLKEHLKRDQNDAEENCRNLDSAASAVAGSPDCAAVVAWHHSLLGPKQCSHYELGYGGFLRLDFFENTYW